MREFDALMPTNIIGDEKPEYRKLEQQILMAKILSLPRGGVIAERLTRLEMHMNRFYHFSAALFMCVALLAPPVCAESGLVATEGGLDIHNLANNSTSPADP